MTDLHDKLRLEIIVEKPALRRMENVLEDAGVKGWTVMPCLSGFGGRVRWTRGTDISGTTDMVVLVSIGGADVIMSALGPLHHVLDRHIGVLSVTEVRVLRPGRF